MSKKLILILSLVASQLIFSQPVSAITLADKLQGRILLQVESHGEAWYVNPANLLRYFLGRPTDAFNLMRKLGIGITDANLIKIDLDSAFARKQSGKIFLQVEQNGEAWYVNPVDLKRYYLGRPLDAFNLMRQLGLGITNSDLNKILVAPESMVAVFEKMEKDIADLINQERVNNGLKPLLWNADLAAVARKHSLNLAQEDENLIREDARCSLPLIHHEDLDLNFGLYNQDRLKSSGIYYLNASAENIAIIPQISGGTYYANEPTTNEISNCSELFVQRNDALKANLESLTTAEDKINLINKELAERLTLVSGQSSIKFINFDYKTTEQVEKDAVVGWMNSPGHRKNILTATYDEAGVGLIEVKGYFIITQVFITRVSCGYTGGVCCEQGGCYLPTKCLNDICQ